MRSIPFDIGMVHFVGIGGIGMSGIAEVMHNLGYAVQGSDLNDSANVQRLRTMGVTVMIGHGPENIGEATAVVISSAVKEDNPEVVAARERKIPIVRRAEMLAELMRLKSCISVGGTHGKTTTTSMIAAVLDAARYDPTVINGGIINAYGTNARLGAGEWMVVEADESDGTFVRLPATIAVVTNIDPEHLDFYGNFDAVKAAFLAFVERVPFYGTAVLCIDHPDVQAMIPQISDRKVVSYGMSPQADVRAINITFSGGEAYFDIAISENIDAGPRVIEGLRLAMPGLHNVQNATAAVAVALVMGISDRALKSAFTEFKGVKRRFTLVGQVAGVTIIDDYGHHPVEITAVLNAARGAYEGRVIAVVQPHRYTRLQSLFEEFCTAFNDADQVVVAPVYEAGEEPITGIDHMALAEGLKARGHKAVHTIDGEQELAPLLAELAGPGDLVICLGAGSISRWAYGLIDSLGALAAADDDGKGAA
jgi:UDP-N-acetylmuramate--alanine ligase